MHIKAPISPALMRELEQFFPPRDFSPKTSDREIMFASGERNVIAFIKNSYEMQQKDAIGGDFVGCLPKY